MREGSSEGLVLLAIDSLTSNCEQFNLIAAGFSLGACEMDPSQRSSAALGERRSLYDTVPVKRDEFNRPANPDLLHKAWVYHVLPQE